MKSAMRSISFSPIPKRVTSIVPRRSPLGRSQSRGVSLGQEVFVGHNIGTR